MNVTESDDLSSWNCYKWIKNLLIILFFVFVNNFAQSQPKQNAYYCAILTKYSGVLIEEVAYEGAYSSSSKYSVFDGYFMFAPT